MFGIFCHPNSTFTQKTTFRLSRWTPAASCPILWNRVLIWALTKANPAGHLPCAPLFWKTWTEWLWSGTLSLSLFQHFFPFLFLFFEDVVAGVIQCWNFILLLYFCRGGLCAETLSRVNWRQEKKLLWGNLKWRYVINEFSLFILSLNVECNHCLIKYCHILVHNLFAVFSSLSFVTSVFICYQQN